MERKSKDRAVNLKLILRNGLVHTTVVPFEEVMDIRDIVEGVNPEGYFEDSYIAGLSAEASYVVNITIPYSSISHYEYWDVKEKSEVPVVIVPKVKG